MLIPEKRPLSLMMGPTPSFRHRSVHFVCRYCGAPKSTYMVARRDLLSVKEISATDVFSFRWGA